MPERERITSISSEIDSDVRMHSETVESVRTSSMERKRSMSKEEQNEKARFLVQYIPGLQDAYSRAISLSYGLVERSFRRNDIILREGEPGKNCFLVKEGLVQLSINRYVMQQRQGMNHPTSPRQDVMEKLYEE